MEKPKIVAVKHKQLYVQRKPLTPLERSLAEEILKRGEKLSRELEERLNQPVEVQEMPREPVAKQVPEPEKKQESQTATATVPLAENIAQKQQPQEKPSLEKAEEQSEQTVDKKEREAQVEKQQVEAVSRGELPKQVKVMKADSPKPKIVARKDYAPTAPVQRQGVHQVQQEIVREVRKQASKDILQVRKEVGKPIGTVARAQDTMEEEMAREVVEMTPQAKKQKQVDDAIRKFEEKEGGKSLVKRLMKSLGL